MLLQLHLNANTNAIKYMDQTHYLVGALLQQKFHDACNMFYQNWPAQNWWVKKRKHTRLALSQWACEPLHNKRGDHSPSMLHHWTPMPWFWLCLHCIYLHQQKIRGQIKQPHSIPYTIVKKTDLFQSRVNIVLSLTNCVIINVHIFFMRLREKDKETKRESAPD